MLKRNRLNNFRGRRLWFAAAFLCVVSPATALAQSGDKDVGEVLGFGGGAFGVGSHGVVGGSSGIAFSRNGMALVEAAYMPMGNNVLRPRSDYVSPRDSHLFDFNLSFHIRIPVKEKFAPYAILGGGLLWNTYSALPVAAVGNPGLYVGADDFRFGFHTGGGFRYYVKENWGIRPEFKVIVSSQTYSRFTIGIFYNVPPLWP